MLVRLTTTTGTEVSINTDHIVKVEEVSSPAFGRRAVIVLSDGSMVDVKPPGSASEGARNAPGKWVHAAIAQLEVDRQVDLEAARAVKSMQLLAAHKGLVVPRA